MGADLGKCCEKENVVIVEAPPLIVEAPAETRAAPAPAAPASPTVTAEEHELDKVRLRQLTTEFVQDAIRGKIEVEVLSNAGQRASGSYSLDRSLRMLYVRT